MIIIIFIKSHLPEYLVAAFVKKLAYISIRVSVDACAFCLVMIYNLIFRHSKIDYLIQFGPTKQKYLSRRQKRLLYENGFIDNNFDNKKMYVENDPFLFNEKNPKHSNACNSQLWELETLCHHVNPKISQLAINIKKQLKEGFPEYKVEEYLDWTMENLFEQTLQSKKYSIIPSKDYRNEKLFNNESLFNELFEF
jgi:U3 small nucleolar RNA-associated protein 19